MLPVAVQVVGELTLTDTSRLQLPEGFGPKVMPPFSENKTGKANSLFWIVKPVLTVTFGLPLNVMFDTAQLAGVTVSVELSLPFPELSSVKMKSPETAIVPPLGQLP